MNDERIDSIRIALMTISASHNIKATTTLFNTWKIAMTELSPNEIADATKYCLQRRKSPYMPTTAEFIGISEYLNSEKAKEKRIDDEIKEEQKYLTHNPVGKEKVKESVRKLSGSINKVNKSIIEKPAFLIYEFVNSNGKVRCFQTKGFVDKEIFSKEVYKQFYEIPSIINHVYKRFQSVKSEDKNKRVFKTYVDCSTNTPGGEKFTIGYI